MIAYLLAAIVAVVGAQNAPNTCYPGKLQTAFEDNSFKWTPAEGTITCSGIATTLGQDENHNWRIDIRPLPYSIVEASFSHCAVRVRIITYVYGNPYPESASKTTVYVYPTDLCPVWEVQ